MRLSCLHALVRAVPSDSNTLPLWSSRQTTIHIQVFTQVPLPFDCPGGRRCPLAHSPAGPYTGTNESGYLLYHNSLVSVYLPPPHTSTGIGNYLRAGFREDFTLGLWCSAHGLAQRKELDNICCVPFNSEKKKKKTGLEVWRTTWGWLRGPVLGASTWNQTWVSWVV